MVEAKSRNQQDTVNGVLPFRDALIELGESRGFHWSRAEVITRGLIKRNIITPMWIPLQGRRLQWGLTPDHQKIVAEAMLYSMSCSYRATHNWWEELKNHLDTNGTIT